MIKEIKAFAADIDMTLSGKGGALPEVTVEAFRILREHNIPLGLATGREIEEHLKKQGAFWELGYEFDFLVGLNGGMIYNLADGYEWNIDMMRTDEMKEILYHMLPLIDERKIAVNVEGGGNHNAMHFDSEAVSFFKRHGFILEDCTGDVEKFCSKPCYKILFRGKLEDEPFVRSRFNEVFADKYDMVSTFPGTIEVIPKGVNKGNGLKRWAEHVGIDIADIITFGDNENDNAMLKMSGWGVALKDGAQKTRDIADDVTDYGCEEGGVGHYLIDYYLKPKGWI